MTDHVTSRSRSFSTSISQRDVIHAHGQIGSNHISTVSPLVLGLSFTSTMRPIMALPRTRRLRWWTGGGSVRGWPATTPSTDAPSRPRTLPRRSLRARQEPHPRRGGQPRGHPARRLLRRPPRPDHGSGELPHRHTVAFTCSEPGADTFIDLI